MNEGLTQKFSSPEEEIAFLRKQIADSERVLYERAPEADQAEIETINKQQLKEYISFTPKMVLQPEYEIQGEELARSVESLDTSSDPVEEVFQLAITKGIRNAMTVLDKTSSAYIIDEVHRKLIEHIKSGVELADLKEGVPPWHVLHMTLYEVTMPAQPEDGPKQDLGGLVGTMEQLLAGFRTIGSAKNGNHFVMEIAVANNSDDIIFYVAVPNEFKTLFEKQTLSLFPNAILTEQANDYNVYVNDGHTLIADVKLKRNAIYPLKMHDEFTADPLAVILNAFSKIKRDGGGAAIQFVVRHPKDGHRRMYEDIIKRIEKGMPTGEAVSRSGLASNIFNSIKSEFFDNKKPGEPVKEKIVDTEALEMFRKKMDTNLLEVNIRVVVSEQSLDQAQMMLTQLESTLNQFDETGGNQILFIEQKDIHLRHAQRAFSFRQFSPKSALMLSVTELATMMHFPAEGIDSTSQFKRSYSKTAPAPTEMPVKGTMLGINKHQGIERAIYSTELDRMRHFYVIGQTGTGKSIFLQNMIVQDIQAGHGVCMIDPHGSDIEDVLGAIPPEREKDVIYFDPSRMDRAIGLNMLEYDVTKPEQKTFVVNELLSIFQKLYGANPESMGPMFEQYFRNAAMLVMEDPDSGNTLMDIGRVMADARFRKSKLAKATNQTVVQFWQEIAGKAGGEASLENVIPYIVSKIDPLTANDYIRPIIGQQTSSFNFREIMDQRKILLVNLSKGRLGELNANLIGMIFVGKILMAALSRVDDPTKGFAPFFLHIDEFQNVSTPAIASILSEARKYKLGLTVAHQFIAQLDPVIKDAVFGNVGSMAAFRVGNDDAKALESQFAPVFTSSDIMNTPNYNAVMRILADGTPTQAFSVATMPPPASSRDKVVELMEQSYATYGRPRAEVEAEISQRYQKPIAQVPPAPPLMG